LWNVSSQDARRSVKTGYLFQICCIDVTPTPLFSALGRLDDGVTRCIKVAARVTVFRRIAAAHVSAFQAHTKVYPCIAQLQAIRTAFGSGLDGFDVIFLVYAGCVGHDVSPFGISLLYSS
jgi:hypothetical protein